MDFEPLREFVDGLEEWVDSTRKGRQAKVRKAVAWSYFQYGCFSMAALPICLPIGQQAMLCQVPSHSYFEAAIGASAGSVVVAGPVVVLSAGVTITPNTGSVALTGVQAQMYAGEVLPRKS